METATGRAAAHGGRAERNLMSIEPYMDNEMGENEKLLQQIKTLTAEREELREALEKIARMRTEPLPNKMWHLILADAYSIAEAAVDRLKNGEQMESIAIAQSEQPEPPRTEVTQLYTDHGDGCGGSSHPVRDGEMPPRTAGEQIKCEHKVIREIHSTDPEIEIHECQKCGQIWAGEVAQ